MATNEIFKDADQIQMVVGSSVAARTPVSIGGVNGITLTATGSSGTTTATVMTKGVVDVSVHSDNGSSCVTAVGDLIYYASTTTPVLTRIPTGTVWGVALEGITNGAVATIRVRIIPSDASRVAANVASSTATALSAAVADHNALVAALKAAGMMTADS